MCVCVCVCVCALKLHQPLKRIFTNVSMGKLLVTFVLFTCPRRYVWTAMRTIISIENSFVPITEGVHYENLLAIYWIRLSVFEEG